VHGSTADHRRWSSILPKFELHFTVYAMDRRGRGGSGDSPDYHILREAEDVAALIESIGEPVSVLGHSYGALCSLEAALLTDKIDKLILYEPPVPTGLPMYSPDFPDQMKALIERGQLEAALEMFILEEVKMPQNEFVVYRQHPMWKERIKIVPTVLREMVIDRIYRFDAAKFANFHVPTLLLLGSDSPPIFRNAIETLDAALPDARVVILPGQQHIAMDTNPELFVREVLGFLRVT
jgi:pimeloyl-ACP methyl ester carboxylesterase